MVCRVPVEAVELEEKYIPVLLCEIDWYDDDEVLVLKRKFLLSLVKAQSAEKQTSLFNLVQSDRIFLADTNWEFIQTFIAQNNENHPNQSITSMPSWPPSLPSSSFSTFFHDYKLHLITKSTSSLIMLTVKTTISPLSFFPMTHDRNKPWTTDSKLNNPLKPPVKHIYLLFYRLWCSVIEDWKLFVL